MSKFGPRAASTPLGTQIHDKCTHVSKFGHRAASTPLGCFEIAPVSPWVQVWSSYRFDSSGQIERDGSRQYTVNSGPLSPFPTCSPKCAHCSKLSKETTHVSFGASSWGGLGFGVPPVLLPSHPSRKFGRTICLDRSHQWKHTASFGASLWGVGVV